jgi:hypothetical protein
MKQIFKIFFLLFFVAINAQESKNVAKINTNSLNMKSGLTSPISYDGIFQSLDSSVISQISEIDFQKRSLIHLLTDSNNHYYLFNMSVLKDNFEKNYFLKNIAKLNFFIQIDHGLPTSLAWIILDNKNENKAISNQLEKLVIDTKRISNSMSKSEKENWLSNN